MAGEPRPLIDYPSVYAFKVMGRAEEGFREWVRQLFKVLLGTEISDDALTERQSEGGKYVSVTVEVLLLSEDQRRAIYTRLHQERRVLYYL